METGFAPRFAEDVLGSFASSGLSRKRRYERRGDAIRCQSSRLSAYREILSRVPS